MFKKIIASFIIAAMAAAPALAGGLSKDAAARFVATLADLKPIMEEIADKDETLGGFDVTPKRGEPYAPYTDGMAVLKERDPALHKKMRAITKKHGFSLADWASTGDQVFLAYMALQLDQQDAASIAAMRDMDPALLANLPPEMRAQMDQAFTMMEAAEAVPQADKKIVKPLVRDLEAFMDID